MARLGRGHVWVKWVTRADIGVMRSSVWQANILIATHKTCRIGQVGGVAGYAIKIESTRG